MDPSEPIMRDHRQDEKHAEAKELEIDPLDRLVSGRRLLELLWDEKSRPSEQWLRKQQRARMIPYVRRGRLIFFRPRTVLDWIRQKETLPNSMKTS